MSAELERHQAHLDRMRARGEYLAQALCMPQGAATKEYDNRGVWTRRTMLNGATYHRTIAGVRMEKGGGAREIGHDEVIVAALVLLGLEGVP